MLVFLAAAASIIIYSIAAFGWGRLAAIYLYKNPIKSIAFEIALGLAVWVFLGGILNALSLANAVALNITFLLGILFSSVIAYSRLQDRNFSFKHHLFEYFEGCQGKIQTSRILPESLPVILLLIASSFLIITLLPTNTFNNNDDFYTYFPRLFRMLQTGRLGDRLAFDFLGFDSLGAHQFLQSFLLNYFPINYINGFDSIFCFLLGGFLLNDIGNKLKSNWLLRTGAITILIIIHPQYLNTSAMYSGSMMIFALIFFSLLFFQSLEKQQTNHVFGAAVIFAFIVSSLIGLKHTFIPFAVTFGALLFLLVLFTKERKKVALAAGFSAPITGIMLAPWFLTVFAKIISFFNVNFNRLNQLLKTANHEILSPGKSTQSSSLLNESSSVVSETSSVISDLFSTHKLFYGGNVSDYSFVVLFSLGAALWASYLLIRMRKGMKRDNLILVCTLGITVFIAYLVSGYFAENFEIGIRYFCPIIIAAFPALVLMFSESSGFIENQPTSHESRTRQGAVLLTMGICIGLFLSVWYERTNQLFEYRSMLSYPLSKNDKYIAYQRKIVSESERQNVLSMQEKIEKGAGILAWFESSFFLDFKRNRVAAISSPDFMRRSSGLSFSDFSDAEKLANYLRSVGIRYVIWGYKDDYPKQNNSGTRELEEGLFTLTGMNTVIYNENNRVVIDINSQQ